MSFEPIVAILLYIAATSLLGIKLYRPVDSQNKLRIIFLLFGFAALLLHAKFLYISITIGSGLNFSFFNVVSLIGCLVALIVMVTSLFRPLENLLLVLFPVAAIALLLEGLVPGERLLTTGTLSTGLRIHILLSICAYSLLMISAFQALLLAVQEKMIKAKRVAKVINILPPLQVMENLLVELIVIGFFLLSLSLVSGMMYIEDLFDQHLVHKTVLSIIAWVTYCILLWGRWAAGWRGKKIIRWALGGFITLLLAYIGSKFVLELILQRV